MKLRTYILTITTCIAAFASCSEWTDPCHIDYPLSHPWDDASLSWKEYTKALREYKSGEHQIVYLKFDNAPEKFVSEKNSLRSVPDSVDIVVLNNADNISRFDMEDLPLMKERGIRILYCFDYAALAEMFADMDELSSALDKAVEAVSKLDLDGWSFTGVNGSSSSVAAALIFEKLYAAKNANQLLVFEGDPQFVPEKERRKLSYVVLNTEGVQQKGVIYTMAASAVRTGVSAGKLILAAEYGTYILNDEQKEIDAADEMASLLVANRQYAGIALGNMADDYWSSDGNWIQLRSVIQKLNPSK